LDFLFVVVVLGFIFASKRLAAGHTFCRLSSPLDAAIDVGRDRARFFERFADTGGDHLVADAAEGCEELAREGVKLSVGHGAKQAAPHAFTSVGVLAFARHPIS
jgi:hypothetical protein